MAVKMGMQFNIALCDHFGLKHVLGVVINNTSGEVFSATVDIALTADDLAAIAARMDGKTPDSEQEPVSAHFDPPATDADLTRFAGHPRVRYDADTLNSIAADARRRLESAVRRGLRNP